MLLEKSIFVYSCDIAVREFCKQYLGNNRLEFYSSYDCLCSRIQLVSPDIILLDYSLFEFIGPDAWEKVCSLAVSGTVYVLSQEDCSSFVNWFKKIGVKEIIEFPCREEFFLSVLFPGEKNCLGESESSEIISDTPELDFLVGSSLKMKHLKSLLFQVAQTDIPLLFLGESGTGKSLFAQAVHRVSGRGQKPFYSVNMGSIPDSLAETELFGTDSGAFTDAVCREGYFSAAGDGTLFLDEIGELSASLQPKLLQVLESKEYRKVGSAKISHCNTRFLFATNADLQKAMEEGRFRSDLYYRIAIVPIEIPPLRERASDIPELSHVFLEEHKKALSDKALDKLMDYSWPGNIRELKNCITRACVMTKDDIISENYISFC